MLYIIIGGSKSKQNNFERGAKGHILLLFTQHFIQTSYEKVSVVRDGIPVINLFGRIKGMNVLKQGVNFLESFYQED